MIVYFAGTAYDGVAGTDRQLADRLAALEPVLYVDPPISLVTPLLRPHLAGSLDGPPLRRQARGLWRLIPRVLPGAYRPGVHHASAALVRRAVRRAARRLGGRVTAVVIATYDAGLLGAVPGARTVFYATDDLVAGADLIGLPRRRLEAARDRLLTGADAVVAVSPHLQDDFRARGTDAAMIPTGCAPGAYDGIDDAPWPPGLEDFGRDRPAAGFVGHINARIDMDVLEGVAAAGHPLLLVGPHDPSHEPARFRALTARPNVRWTGRRSFAELPSHMRVIKVGLTPYARSAFNDASFPIKTFDYLAAGRAVVASELPSTRWLRDRDPEGAELIRAEAGAAGFVRAVGEELAAEAPAGTAARRRRFAERHDWTHRARDLARVLDIPAGSAREEVPAP
ncbi:glycosyltransferase [Actinomadura rugatobispora]|uniref:Glycosyltransferase n=1 Tax=Actinomadura rugatobispora TaxID=1994 RepID=A0ABW1AB28_9ACTN|nr:hypothetical protein GCM10010200_066860 [Actinomadura rugatobispora]